MHWKSLSSFDEETAYAVCGYILAGVHNLQPDISPENIIAMYEEGAKFGRYPIKKEELSCQ